LYQTLVFLGSQVDMFTKSGMCAPIMPGMSLFDSNVGQIFQAPWWAPPSFKEQAFAKVCSSDDILRTPTSLEWAKYGQNNKLILNVDGKVKVNRIVAKAEIAGNSIRLWKRNGHAEELNFLW
jgi:hypothetical protein